MQDNDDTKNYITYVTSITPNKQIRQTLFPAGKHPRMRLVGGYITTLRISTGGMLHKTEIKNVLEEIKESMINEMEPILSAYKNQNHLTGHALGFWTIPRLLFMD